MARKVVNRKELRAEAEAAEALGKAAPGAAGEKAEKKGKAKAEKKPAVKRKSRAKSSEPARMKLFWGVFNQSLKRVALYDFTQRRQAEAKAQELSASGKSPHFIQKVKEAITG